MNILIIKPSSLGDIIHALPFLKAVKDRYPDARVDWVISRNLKGLIEGHPLINELIIIDKDSWKRLRHLPGTISEIFSLATSLRKRRYDIIADLQGLLRSGIISLITPGDTKIGFEDAREGSHLCYNKRVPANGFSHAVDRNLQIARAVGAKVSTAEFPISVDNQAEKRAEGLVASAQNYILIVPSARWASKRWPARNFASLVKRLPIGSVITGSEKDREIASEIAAAAPEMTINLCGDTDLKQLVALISGARAVVSSDSGPMHIAAALGVPVVALFGPTDEDRTGPYGWQEKGNLSVVSMPVTCRPCFKKRCRDPVCISGITVDMVLRELKDIMNSAPGSRVARTGKNSP